VQPSTTPRTASGAARRVRQRTTSGSRVIADILFVARRDRKLLLLPLVLLLLVLTVLMGGLTWLALVHSSRTLFALWMRFARALQTVAITTIFSVCYLVIVPVFRVVLWFRDPLHLRRPPDETAWVARTATVDATSMERMG
jgi:hypothetical protein